MAASDYRRQRRANGTGKPKRTPAAENGQHHTRPSVDPLDIEVVTNDPGQLPHDERAENGLIDSAFQDAEVLRTCGYIKPRYFFRAHNGVIWQAMQEMAEAGRKINDDTLRDYLLVKGKLEAAGGEVGIGQIGLRVTHSGFALEYARIVGHKFYLRESERATAVMAKVAHRGDVQETARAWTLSQAELQEIAAAIGLDANGNPNEGPRHRLKTLAEMRNKPRAEWIIPGVLHERKRSLIFGDSNTGKSFLAVDLGLSIATGYAWHGHPVHKPGAVVYVCAEGADDIINRVDVWLQHHGIADAPNFWIVDDSPNLLELGDVSGVIAQINNTLDEPPALVIFDTLAASMVGGDEKDSLDMGIVIGAIHRVQQECQCGVLTVHHTGKDESKGPRGSSALRADVDMALRVTVDSETDVIAVNGDKWRSGDKKKLSFGFRRITKALDDHADLTSCILEATGYAPVQNPTPTNTYASSASASGRLTAPDRLFALMQEIAKPLRDGELQRLFVERHLGAAKTYEAAIAELRRRHVIENVNGGWVVVGVIN